MGNELQVMGLNIAICDDEKVIREQIKELAEKEMPCVCDGLYEKCKEMNCEILRHKKKDCRNSPLSPVIIFQFFCIKEKDFVPFQIGFRSLAADCAKILPI